jgi:hypothetical protein
MTMARRFVSFLLLGGLLSAASFGGSQAASSQTVKGAPKKSDADAELIAIEREVLNDYQGKPKPAPELLKAYAAFVQTARKNPGERINDKGTLAIEVHCLPKSVTIKNEERAKPGYGEGINIRFLLTGFRPEIRKLEKLDQDCYIIRTPSSILWFVETEMLGWKLYRYHDAPL